jgi:hypothetical protein
MQLILLIIGAGRVFIPLYLIYSFDLKNPMLSLSLYIKTTSNENETYSKLNMIISILLEYLIEIIANLPWGNHCATYLCVILLCLDLVTITTLDIL